MIELGFVVPTGALVLLAFFYLRKIEGSRTASSWGWAWVALYASGITVALTDLWPGFMALSILGNSLFAGFMLAGALAYVQDEKRWVVPLATALGLLRGAMFLAGHESLTYALAFVFVVPMSVAAAWVVRRAAIGREATAPDRMLAPALALNAVITAVAPIVNALGKDTLPLVVLWANVAILLAFLQFMALHERRRRQQESLLAETARQTQALEQERIMLQALVDAVPAGIMLVDADGFVSNMNGLGAENFGLGDPSQWIGRRSLEVFANVAPRMSHESTERVRAAIDRADRDFTYSDEGYEVRLLEPTERIFILYSRPVLSANAVERIGEAWVTWDVTDQRQLADRLQQAHRLETLGTLAGGVAHDFNNQLTPIIGNAHYLASKLPDDENLQEAASDLQRAAEHCAELTRDLLAVAQRTPTRPTAVALENLIGEVVKLLSATLPAQLELVVDVEPGTRPLRADPTQLRRVITNLIVNARDAVGPRGRIEIRARDAELKPGDEGQHHVVIEVRDDGAGMDAETRDHIFDPFFTTKSLGKGTGLGLSIVYGIVELHGATITVDSRSGHGTCFRLEWPADEARARSQEAPEGDPIPAAGNETILLVDDEVSVRRLARRGLELHGYRVIEAEDGEQALRLHAEHAQEVDMAVVDFSMPGRDGAEVIQLLRSQRADLPAILMSGHLDRDGLGGPNVDARYLAKPFRPDQLAQAVRDAIDEQPS